jgi:hypothetical protein
MRFKAARSHAWRLHDYIGQKHELGSYCVWLSGSRINKGTQAQSNQDYARCTTSGILDA